MEPAPGVRVAGRVAVVLGGLLPGVGLVTDTVRFTPSETDARGRAVAEDFIFAAESGDGAMESREAGFVAVEDVTGALTGGPAGALGAIEVLLEGGGTAETGTFGGIADFVRGGPDAVFLIGELIPVGLAEGAVILDTDGLAAPAPKVPEFRIYKTQ